MSDAEKPKAYYMGRPIEELTKEALIDAVILMHKELVRMRDQHSHDLQFLTMCAEESKRSHASVRRMSRSKE